MLPDGLKEDMEREAARENVSLGELVRQALQRYLLWRREKAAKDSFLNSQTVFRDDGPIDVSLHHDDYLSRKDVHGKP